MGYFATLSAWRVYSTEWQDDWLMLNWKWLRRKLLGPKWGAVTASVWGSEENNKNLSLNNPYFRWHSNRALPNGTAIPICSACCYCCCFRSFHFWIIKRLRQWPDSASSNCEMTDKRWIRKHSEGSGRGLTEVLSRHLPRRAEKKHEKLQPW